MKFRRTLLASCNNGDITSALYHIAKGADVNGTDSRGWFPLGGAAYHGSVEITELLIEFGANVNQTSEYGWTPLYIAAWEGNNNIVEILLKHNAHTDTRTIAGYKSPGEYTPLHIACELGHYDVVKTLLKSRVEINPRDSLGRTPLDLAGLNRRKKVQKYLKKNGGKHSQGFLKEMKKE